LVALAQNKGRISNHMIKLISSVVFVLVAGTLLATELPSTREVKLYTLDCGTIDVSDMRDLSEHGEYAGEKIQLANPCFLIQHPKGNLLWDTGHNDTLADTENGVVSGVWHSKMQYKLQDQLQQLGLAPKDINYLSLSHVHPDHSGNANLFSNATFVVQELERNYMFSEQIKSYFGEFYAELEQAKTITFNDEYDVFDDNTVVIKTMPGHTPGSSVLLVRLKQAGNVLLTGDLYIHARERQLPTMLKYNTDKQATLASRAKFEILAKNEQARVVIQHELQDFKLLPKFPKFLD
jgi:N-acyl homoserine lactone hydrolase